MSDSTHLCKSILSVPSPLHGITPPWHWQNGPQPCLARAWWGVGVRGWSPYFTRAAPPQARHEPRGVPRAQHAAFLWPRGGASAAAAGRRARRTPQPAPVASAGVPAPSRLTEKHCLYSPQLLCSRDLARGSPPGVARRIWVAVKPLFRDARGLDVPKASQQD